MGKKKITVEVDETAAEAVVQAIDVAEEQTGSAVVEPTVEDVQEVAPVEPTAEVSTEAPQEEISTPEPAPVEPVAPADSVAEAPADLPVVETAPVVETTEDSPAVAPQAELPTNAHTYYVWKDGVFDKFFTNEVYKGEALKFAREYADQIGGTIEASGIYQ